MSAELKQAALVANAALVDVSARVSAATDRIVEAENVFALAQQQLMAARDAMAPLVAEESAKRQAQQDAYMAHAASEPGEPLYSNVNDLMVMNTDEQIAAIKAEWAALEEEEQAKAKHYLVPKLVIIDRLIAAGLLQPALDALSTDTVLKARWDACTSVYADDPAAVALLTAVGAEPAVILAAA